MESDDKGTILGIHNMFICLPQLLSTLISYMVFRVVGEDQGSDPFGWAIRVGSIFSLVGAFMVGYVAYRRIKVKRSEL